MSTTNAKQRRMTPSRAAKKLRNTNSYTSDGMEDVDMLDANVRATPSDNADDETVVGGNKTTPEDLIKTRCTLKLQMTGGKNAFGRGIGLLKEFFTQLQIHDKHVQIAPWYEDSRYRNLETPGEIMTDPNILSNYLPRFMNRKNEDKGRFNENVSIYIVHSEYLEDLQLDLGTWMNNGNHALYIEMLQVERKKEAGFFTNSLNSMDKINLAETLEAKIGFRVGLRWKPIAGTFGKGGPTRAMHVELDAKHFHLGLRKLSDAFGMGISGFDDGRKMRFFASLINVKSKATKLSIKKAIARQGFFEKNVRKAYFSDITELDIKPTGSTLPSMRKMLTNIKSIQFPHLRMIHSVDETWEKIRWKGDYTYLVMPQLEEEADLMMNNLLPYLRHEYGDEVMDYFTSDAKEIAKDDKWDPISQRVICAVDRNAEMDDEDDDLGFAEAVKFLNDKEEEKAKDSKNKSNTEVPERPSTNTQALSNEEIQQAAAERINAMTNAAEAAYYKDDDSISTLGSIGATTIGTRTTVQQQAYQTQSTPSVRLITDTPPIAVSDNMSVTSSITMESFTNLQSKVNDQDAKLSRIDLVLAKIAASVLKDDEVDQPDSSQQGEGAGGNNVASGIGS